MKEFLLIFQLKNLKEHLEGYYPSAVKQHDKKRNTSIYLQDVFNFYLSLQYIF